MRIMIVENGKVVPGQEERFQRYLEKEMEKLKAIDARLREEDPEYAEVPPPEDWMEETHRGVINASFRLGTGCISVEEDE